MPEKIRLMIADDHRMVREGIKAFIASEDQLFEVVGEAKDGIEAVEVAARTHPDIILLDLLMPRLDGIGATQEILKNNPHARVLIITSYVEDEKVIAAIRAGAAGYLLKDSSPEDLRSAMLAIAAGGSILPPRIAGLVVRELQKPEKPAKPELPLTAREVEILKMVAQGLSNQAIADRLVISVWTVRTHITAILNKLRLENRTQAALYAIRIGLVDRGPVGEADA
jgi:NarL family two-component system response regulator LiaR